MEIASAIVFQKKIQKEIIIPDKHEMASDSAMLVSLQLCQRPIFSY